MKLNSSQLMRNVIQKANPAYLLKWPMANNYVCARVRVCIQPELRVCALYGIV